MERHSNCGSLDGCDKEADDQLLANFKKTDAEDYNLNLDVNNCLNTVSIP